MPFASQTSNSADMGDAEVSCEICGITFWHKWSLSSALSNRTRHMKEVHATPEGLKCNQCGKTFSRKDTLKTHIKRQHDEEKPESYPCSQCDKQFTQKDNLQRHVKNSHNKERPFECSECCDSFSRMEHLKSHEERGKHSLVMSCEHCYQDLTFKSSEAAQRHLINHPIWPSEQTCQNAKYALGKMPTEEQKEAFMKRRGEEQFEEDLKRDAKEHFRRCYGLSCKCSASVHAERAKSESWDKFEEKFIKEEREKTEKRRQYWKEKEFNKYDADKSMIDPCSKDPIQEPVRNRECGHVYDRKALLASWERADYWSRNSTTKSAKGYLCPYYPSCTTRIKSIDELEPDTAMAAEIEKRKEKKRKQKEEKKKKDARDYAEMWERRKRNREEKEQKKKREKSKAKKEKAKN